MYPITSYKVTPNVFGVTRWMAEIDGQRSRFARRSYSRDRAEQKIAHDENHLWDTGRETFMQGIVLPLMMPIRRAHDRLCRAVDQRRRMRRVRVPNRENGSER